MYPKIENGAIFIADAHEDERKNDFYLFLQQIESKKIETTQLFLMGDMFDLLIGKVEYSVNSYKRYIELIDQIALHVEVYYFEGNHDFALENLFKNVKIVPIQLQPMQFVLEDNTVVYLLHGDRYSGLVYSAYTKIIRSTTILSILNFFDKKSNYGISKRVKNSQLRKKLCTKIENFEDIIGAKIPKYNPQQNSYIVEGHYHQNYMFRQNSVNYINLASFACNQSYFIVECSKHNKFTQCKLRG